MVVMQEHVFGVEQSRLVGSEATNSDLEQKSKVNSRSSLAQGLSHQFITS